MKLATRGGFRAEAMRVFRVAAVGGWPLWALGFAGCQDALATEPPAVPGGDGAVSAMAASPLAGLALYVDPASKAREQVAAWRASRPADAAQIEKIAAESQARWFGNWNRDVRSDVSQAAGAAAANGAVPVLVAYNIPQRDCGSYSAGGSGSPEAYRTWISAFAAGLGTRKAVVILEPDALAGMDCLNAADRDQRLALLRYAVDELRSRTGAMVYVDAGHARWHSAGTMAARLKEAGVEKAHGFSLNVSNYVTTDANLEYGTRLAGRVGGKHFVIDTSRNGRGPAGDEWCNPEGRGLGPRPTTRTGHELVDAYLWIKVPGESDGTCNGGPAAGAWWAEYALGLAQLSA